MSELCDHEEKCVLLKELKQGYSMKMSDLRKENKSLKTEMGVTAKKLRDVAQWLLKASI